MPGYTRVPLGMPGYPQVYPGVHGYSIKSLEGEPKSTSWMDFQNMMVNIWKPAQGLEGQKCSAVQRKDITLGRPHSNLEKEWSIIGGQWALFWAWVKLPLQLSFIFLYLATPCNTCKFKLFSKSKVETHTYNSSTGIILDTKIPSCVTWSKLSPAILLCLLLVLFSICDLIHVKSGQTWWGGAGNSTFPLYPARNI